MRPYHDDNSPLSELAQQAISEGEAAWERISSGDWDVSAWQVMGAALTLLRQQTLRRQGIEVPRGGPYNEAFAERVNKTKFATMPPVTRSDLLYLMEPEIRVVLDRLLASWTPAIRAKRTHPTTLRQHVRAALKPKPQPKPAPTSKPAAASAKPASSAQSAEPVMTLDMISTKSGQEQAKAFMRQCAKWIDAEIELGVRALWLRGRQRIHRTPTRSWRKLTTSSNRAGGDEEGVVQQVSVRCSRGHLQERLRERTRRTMPDGWRRTRRCCSMRENSRQAPSTSGCKTRRNGRHGRKSSRCRGRARQRGLF